MSRPITVVVIDDQPLLRAGVRSLLEKEADIQLVGLGWVGDHLHTLVSKYRPDVVLLDLNMRQHESDEIEREMFRALPAIARLHEEHPQTVVIVLSQYISVTLIESAFELGVRGYILKEDVRSENLATAIRTVTNGQLFLSEAIRDELVRSQTEGIQNPLTGRQREIVYQMASDLDLPYAVHAEALKISEQAMRNHLTNIFKALDVTNLSACIVRCMELGIIPFETKYIQ